MTTTYANPGDNLTSKANALSDGDTLILNDGTYGRMNLQGVNGSSGSRITIQAAHDGKAVIDGGGSSPPIYCENTSYITIQGVHAQNSSQHVYFLWNNSHHLIFQRCTGNQSGNCNCHVFACEPDASGGLNTCHDNLFEDCAGYGRGRYMFIAQSSNHITFRRCYGHWDANVNWSNAPRATFISYGSQNTLLENCVGVHAIPTSSQPDYYNSMWQDSISQSNANMTLRGCIFYNCWAGHYFNDLGAGSNMTFTDVYWEIPYISQSLSTRERGYGFFWNGPSVTTTLTNCTFRLCSMGVDKHYSSGTVNLVNCLFVNNDTAITGSSTNHSYCNFYGNTSNGVTPSGTDHTYNPGQDTTKYGRGGAIFVPTGSPLHGAGQSGADIGCNILYQTVDGTLTGTPLWPWPMEARIMAERGVSVTWESGGGIWKTLDGIYGGGGGIVGTPIQDIAATFCIEEGMPGILPTLDIPATLLLTEGSAVPGNDVPMRFLLRKPRVAAWGG